MEAVPLRTVRGFVRTEICRPFFNYIQPVSNLREILYRKHLLVLEKEKKCCLGVPAVAQQGLRLLSSTGVQV